jgi:hypothetical protein
MSYKEIFFIAILLIILVCTTIATVIIPLYRHVIFKNKVAYIKDKYFENKFEAIIFIILFPIIIVLTILNLFSGIGQDTVYLSSIILLRIYIPLYIICNVIARLPKQCIYKEGIKTNLYFVKWNEIESMNEDKNNLRIIYQYRYVFFKFRHTYIIKDCPIEIKELLHSFISNRL